MSRRPSHPEARPRAARGLPAAALLLLALPACDLGTTTNAPAVAGEWLTVQYVFSSTGTPTETATVIPDRGWFRFISLSPGGYHEDNTWSPADRWNSRQGTWNANDSIIVINRPGTAPDEEWSYELLSDRRVRITIPQGRSYDFDDDGAGESTTETLELVRADNNPDLAIQSSWTADSYTFTSVADTTVSYGVIEDGGTYTIAISPTGSFQYSETIPGSDGTRVGGGEIAASDGFIWLMENNRVEFGSYTVGGDGDTLTLRFEDAAWDFDDDGTDEQAIMELRLTK